MPCAEKQNPAFFMVFLSFTQETGRFAQVLLIFFRRCGIFSIFYGFTISFHHSKEVFVCCLIVSLPCVFWVAPSIRGGGGGGIDSPRPASQRAAAFILTAAMLTTLAAPAFAGTWYIENGDITVKAGETKGQTRSHRGESGVEDTDTIITNRNEVPLLPTP